MSSTTTIWMLTAVLAFSPACATTAQSRSQSRADSRLQSRYPVEENETIRRNLDFAGSDSRSVELDNISGRLHVVGYDGRSVEMVAGKTIHGATAADVAQAKQDVKLDITDKEPMIRIYVDGPDRSNDNHWHDGWRTGSDGHHYRYDVAFGFELKIPRDVRMRLRTVNGEIELDGTSGDFDVEGVNGAIQMSDIRGSGSVTTVNGQIHASFAENPKSATSFKSTNGAIEVAFQPDLSADLRLKTFNGGLYTDFDVKSLPGGAVTAEHVNGKYVYRGNAFTSVRVGNGGPEIKFEGFNGDVRVLRRTR